MVAISSTLPSPQLEAALPSGNFAELPSTVHKANAPFV
jgi:hypothetical protein